jgi:MFS superfamily sulfate permease-like transporter
VSWRETLDLLPVAGSCFVMIIAQSAAPSRVYATIHKERVDENADILGLAAANAAAAVSGAFVANGSRRESPGEFLLALFTAAAVPAIGVEQGILLAIALSLVQHACRAVGPPSPMPRLVEECRAPPGKALCRLPCWS